MDETIKSILSLKDKLLSAIKEKTLVELSEQELVSCLQFIPNASRQDVIYLCYLLCRGLTDDSKKMLEEFYTPYLVKAVYVIN